MTVTLIIPTAINQLTYINDALVTASRRGFDASIEMPTLRERAKAAQFENTVMRVEETVDTTLVGEFKP